MLKTREREDLEGIPPVQRPIEAINVAEVATQLAKMTNKTCGPDCLPIEVGKTLGYEGVIWMTGELKEMTRNGIPGRTRFNKIAIQGTPQMAVD